MEAEYTYWDSPSGGTRLHYWSNGLWAIGTDPIYYIHSEVAKKILADWEQEKDRRRSR